MVQRSDPADDALSDAAIAAAMLGQVACRGPRSSICPSEVARALSVRGRPHWRALMPRVRAVARELALAGRVVVTQGGEVRDPREDWRGPIRIAQPADASSSSSI